MTQREEFEAKLKLVDSSLNQTRDYPYDVETDDYDDYLINNIYHGFKMGVEHAKAKSVAQWIPVSDPPSIGQLVLIKIAVGDSGGYEIEGAKYKGDGVFFGAWCSSRGNKCTYKVIGWMPRPDLPESPEFKP